MGIPKHIIIIYMHHGIGAHGVVPPLANNMSPSRPSDSLVTNNMYLQKSAQN